MSIFHKLLVSSLTAVALIAPAAFPVVAHDDTTTETSHKENRNRSAVYFLLDEKAVAGFGHAALLVGDESGWDYYSFGPHSTKNPRENNLVHEHFETLADACSSKDLRRYTKQLCWTARDARKMDAVRQRILKDWDNSSYNLLTRNCFHMVADAVSAGSFDIDKHHAAPVSAFKANETKARGHGAWPVAQH